MMEEQMDEKKEEQMKINHLLDRGTLLVKQWMEGSFKQQIEEHKAFTKK